MNGHILLLTGSAPYLGGPQTWQPLRDAAPADDLIASVKSAIETAAMGASAVVAHGSVAAIALESLAKSPYSARIVLLSPVAVTKDSAFLRVLRALLRGPAAGWLTKIAYGRVHRIHAAHALRTVDADQRLRRVRRLRFLR